MAAGLSESADPGWPGASACGAVGKRFQSLRVSKQRGLVKLKLGAGAGD